MPKPQDIFQLAQQEAVRVTASPQAWQSFLYTAAHNYHTTYLNQLLIHAQRPDAVFCQNDVLAIGFLDVARNRYGLNVPDDLAVVGFDDIPAASQFPYQLTTVQQPLDAMMTEAVSLISHQIASSAPVPETRLLPGRIIERQTVRSPV